VRVVADRDVVLEADVQPLEVLAHQHQVDILVAPAGNEGARRPQVGIEVELLAQPHVGGAEAAADRGGERALEREARLADALQGRLGQWIAGFLEPRHSRRLPVVGEGSTDGFEHAERGVEDFGSDAVARNERDEDGLRSARGRGLLRHAASRR
jgi:hypothetical protein